MILNSNSWRNITPLETSGPEVEAILGLPERKFHNVEYSKNMNLELWSYDALAVSIYLKEGKVQFLCIDPNSKNQIPTKGADWIKALGKSEEHSFLKSDMGKNVYVKIYARKGLALHVECVDFSHEKYGHLDLIEIFPSTSLENYLAHFYKGNLPLEH